MTRGLACLVLLGAVTASVGGPVPPLSEETTRLTLRPAAAPVPALKYQLLPELVDQTPGNAAMLYRRAQAPGWPKDLYDSKYRDKLNDYVKMPFKDLPRDELDWLLNTRTLRELDRAARR